MKYKAIIMDVDGTAVPNAIDALPSKNVVHAIHRAQKRVRVCASTSRPIFIAKYVIRALGIVDPCGINDATQIYDPKTETIIEMFPLSQKATRTVSKFFQAKKIQFMYNTGESEQWYTKGPLPDTICGLAIPDLSPTDAEALIASMTHILNISVHKVPSYTKGLIWIAVTSPVATKLHSVLELTKLIHVTPEETIGIGDGYNDYPLLSACGLKIAMGNAVPELKAIADFVAPSVEEDGVATVIEKFILN
jgi:hydroxymethylpyrimidine pyrophosphatase-like HAD family hydrolase